MGRRLALALALATSLAAGACHRERSCEPADDGSVVACLNDSPIPSAEVEQHLRPQGPAPGRAALPDPRSAAFEAALRVRLFAAEARRRGLAVDGDAPAAQRRARLHRALIRDELARNHIGPEHISDADARRFYEANPGRVNEIDAVHCFALYVDDPGRAEALYRELSGAGREAFVAAGGTDIGTVRPGDGARDVELRKLAVTLRAPGAVSGPVRTADGRYLLLYADSVEIDVAPFEGIVVARTKNVMARAAERAALDALFEKLRADSRVRVFDDALAALPEPGDGQRKP